MTPYFNFTRLIKKYSTRIEVLTTESGHYNDSGDFVPDYQDEAVLRGAVLSKRENKTVRADGAHSEKECVLYLLYDPEIPLTDAYIIANGSKYRVTGRLENADFTGVYRYSLKYVSLFDGGKK